MARQLRIECEGGLYHITARGNERRNIFREKEDWQRFLEGLSVVIQRFGWLCHSYCLMSNHYHLLIETPQANLSSGMRLLNSSYAQYFNQHYNRVGHVFQGRFKGMIVEKDAYLLELSRYIVLNPVRAEMVRSAVGWPWSSYRAMVGKVAIPEWLTCDWLLRCFGIKRGLAQQAYGRFVSEGMNQPSPFKRLKNQIYLGSDAFVEEMQCKLDPEQSLKNIPLPQLARVKKPLSSFSNNDLPRNEQLALAYHSGCYTQNEIGNYFGVSHATVSRAVKALEGMKR